jgi:hypothetical protein
VIHKIEFSAKTLTSNAGLFLFLEHANKNGIFDMNDHDLVFDNAATNKIKMNHIKTMLCGNGFDQINFLFTRWRDDRQRREPSSEGSYNAMECS